MDAAVAMSAVLCVVETGSTDIGGDAFALFYNAKDKKVHGINGCGRSASAIDLDLINDKYQDHIHHNRLKSDSVLTCNVPGAIAAWNDAIEWYGSGNVSFAECLQPAIDLAENGYPICKISAMLYHQSEADLQRVNAVHGETFLNEQVSIFLPNEGLTAPQEGQFMKNPLLAKTLRLIASQGPEAFYQGSIANAIVNEVQYRGGLLTLKDLEMHSSTRVFPINYELLGHKLWEIPPNGSGIIALLALGIIKALDANGEIKLSELKHNSLEYLHLVIESLKLAFKDSEEYVHDPEHHSTTHFKLNKSSQQQLLTTEYFEKRSKFFNKSQALDNSKLSGSSVPNSSFKSDTVYFSVTDSQGNAASFINSVFTNFGSCILVPDHGFFLQNRGSNFSLHPGSLNCISGSKRPYHTIIPGMITKPSENDDEELYATFGIQGGFNQPQAHVQVYLNLLLFGMTPQEALDAPRMTMSPSKEHTHTDGGLGAQGPVSTSITTVNIEEGVDPKVIEGLRSLGHEVNVLRGKKRTLCGRGQIIKSEMQGDARVYSGGSDPRGDGAAAPFLG